MQRSHLWGFLAPLLLGLAGVAAALIAVGAPLAILLSLFGEHPLATLAFVVMTDRTTMAGAAGAAGLAVFMWFAHIANRRIGALPWLGTGIVGYFIGALAIFLWVPHIGPGN